MNIESIIKSVTVYTDRAQILRESSITAGKGIHSIVFENLSPQIMSESIQISADKALVLKDIKYEKTYLSVSKQEERLQIEKQRDDFKDELRIVTDEYDLSIEEKEFVKNINQKVFSSKHKKANELLPENWQPMMDFYHNKMMELDERIRKLETKKGELVLEVDRTNIQLEKLGSDQFKENHQVILEVEILSDEAIDLKLRYMVRNASWLPTYDIRVDNISKSMNISYNAIIKQNTGEHWKDVQFMLSTARPNITGTAPELSQWNIHKYVAPPMVENRPLPSRMAKSRSIEREETVAFGMKEEMDEFIEPAAPVVKVEQSGAAQVFVIDAKNTVMSDNQPHKVGFTVIQFDSDFEYTAVPKLTNYVYQKAMVKNRSDFTLLAGEANIFYDGNFVSTSRLNTIQPSEKVLISLGIDESFRMERKLVDKFNRDEGLFSKKRHKTEYHHQIKIKNNKKTAEKLFVFDQIPKSQDKEIEILLLSPRIKENSEDISLDQNNRIKWNVLINSGEELILDVKYSVEFPIGERIIGME